MRTIICTVFLCLASFCQAQKTSKNEISLGYFTGGYFFDSTGLRLSAFDKAQNLSLHYARHLNKHFSIGLTYSNCAYRRFRTYPSFLEPNTVIRRHFKAVSVHAGYRIYKWSMTAQAKAGINYRFSGEKYVHYFYVFPNNPWIEPVRGRIGYKEFGATVGLLVSHPIFWKIFGEIDCEYARMFPKAYETDGILTFPRVKVRADPNQLLLSYRIGVRF